MEKNGELDVDGCFDTWMLLMVRLMDYMVLMGVLYDDDLMMLCPAILTTSETLVSTRMLCANIKRRNRIGNGPCGELRGSTRSVPIRPNNPRRILTTHLGPFRHKQHFRLHISGV